MRRLLCTALAAAALLAASAVPAAAAGRTVPVQVDGALLADAGRLENGVTYVPLRALLDAFGGWDLRWDAGTKTAVAKSGSATLTADPAADTLTLGASAYPGAVYVENGRTYVPLRSTAGLCGAETVWDGVLGGAAVTSPDADHDARDLYWLSRIISAESRGEPLEGQIAVGNVVLNRVADGQFPATIPGVIFDREDGVQFEPVENGTVYDAPTDLAVEAAKRVLGGAETVGDCLYFYAPALSQGLWMNENRSYSTTIGCHRFYR